MKFTKNAMRYTRGFTLIELLVVIAIIGILSSIVLASLATARSKANDSKVQEQLSSLRSAAEIFNSSNGGYNTGATYVGATSAACTYGTSPTSGTWSTGVVFDDSTSGSNNIMIGIASTTGVTIMSCVASSTAWAVAVPLPSGGVTGAAVWCADSTGKEKGEPSGTTVTASALCP